MRSCTLPVLSDLFVVWSGTFSTAKTALCCSFTSLLIIIVEINTFAAATFGSLPLAKNALHSPTKNIGTVAR